MKKFAGFIYGIVSSASFGLIPLFALPVLASGMGFMSVLLYRFVFATAMLAIALAIKGISFKVSSKDLVSLTFLAIFYIISSVFLMWGYTYMSSGVATTIHFMYPVITTIIMMTVFNDKRSIWRILAIAMAIFGVYLLSNTSGSQHIKAIGVIIVLISALGYALYLVSLGQMKKLKVRGLKLTFYVFLISTVFMGAGMLATGGIEHVPDTRCLISLLLLALVPTVISNLTLVESIKRIGSTLASVLGAMEPVTAVLVGILVFSEALTLSIGAGIILILSAVLIIIIKK